MGPELAALRLASGVTVGVLAAALAAKAASFDCSRAGSRIEHLVCTDTGLSALDDRLAAEMKVAMARVGDQRSGLLAEQRAWLHRRDKVCSVIEREPDAVSCVRDTYDLRIAQLKASPSVCQRMAARLKPLIESDAMHPSTEETIDWIGQLSEERASGIAEAQPDIFAYSPSEWERGVKRRPNVLTVDPDLSEEVHQSVEVGAPIRIFSVSSKEQLYAAEVPQGRHSCLHDIYFTVSDGRARLVEDFGIEDAGNDGDTCHESRRFGSFDGTPAIIDDERVPPSLSHQISVRARDAGSWTPPCLIDLTFASRFLPARTEPGDASAPNHCQGVTCSSFSTEASRLAESAQARLPGIEAKALSALSAEQKRTYQRMKQIAKARDDTEDPCGADPDLMYAPVVMEGVLYLAQYHHPVMGCLGVISSDWDIRFTRLEGAGLQDVEASDVGVRGGALTSIKARWLP